MTSSDISSLLADVQRISAQIDAEDDPDRKASLEAKREKLRARAASMAVERRHPQSVEAEIEMLQARRDEINEMLIGKGYAEKWMKQTIQDPGAYSHNINKQIAEDHQAELVDIDKRLGILLELTAPDEPSE